MVRGKGNERCHSALCTKVSKGHTPLKCRHLVARNLRYRSYNDRVPIRVRLYVPML